MTKEEIEKLFDKYGFKKVGKVEPKFPRNWENPPIPEGMRMVFESF